MDLASQSDSEVVARLYERSSEALDELYHRYAGPVFALSFRILREAGASEDVVQDVFLRLWRQPGAYDAGRGALGSWLLSVAHHRAIDLLRRRKTRAEQSLPEEGLLGEISEDGSVDPAEVAGQHESAIAVRKALAKIPPAQRQVIEMAFFQGKTHAEISAELNEPLGTAKTRIRLGMRKLRSLLEAEGIVRLAE